MARQELARRLEELNMTAGEAKGYGALLDAVQAHIVRLHDLFERTLAVWFRSYCLGLMQVTCRPLCERRGASLGETTDRRGTGRHSFDRRFDG